MTDPHIAKLKYQLERILENREPGDEPTVMLPVADVLDLIKRLPT